MNNKDKKLKSEVEERTGSADNTIKVGLVIPCYNEQDRLECEEILSFAQKNSNVAIHLVNDGSTDNTLKVIEELSAGSPNLNIINIEKNMGKAEAVRTAILQLSASDNYDYLGFFDADLSTPLSEIYNFIEVFNNNQDIEAVTGARVALIGRSVLRPATRHYLGRIFATVVSIMLKLPVYDTQCGAKIFKTNLAKSIFKEKFITKWLFDVELLFRIKKYYPSRPIIPIYELPLNTWHHTSGSKIGIRDFIKVPFELCKIYFKYR